jgi:hypothetical protein
MLHGSDVVNKACVSRETETAMSRVKPQVFLSYSRLPPENAQFAEELAHILRGAGFEPWLDEEMIPPGADFERLIRQAIAESQHGLFIVTRRWLERTYTRIEIALFANHDSAHQPVAVLREDIPERDLPAQLMQLDVIRWLPDEPDREAQLWQVYCGLTHTAPGPRTRWADQGRKLIKQAGPTHEPTLELDDVPTAEPGLQWFACASRPVFALPGRQQTFLLTDASECLIAQHTASLPGRKTPQPHANLDGCSALIADSEGTVMAGLYASMVACHRGGTWEFKSLDAPVLSLAAMPQGGAAVGDSAGIVTLMHDSGSRLETVRFGPAVVDLVAHDHGLVALGTDNTLGRLSWADEGAKELETLTLSSDFDRPVGLFPCQLSRVGLFSADLLAVMEGTTGRITAGNRSFAEGIRQVVYLGRGAWCYGVLSDPGTLFLVDTDLSSVRPLTLPGGSQDVAGIQRSPSGGLLAWTAHGELFSIDRDRTVRRLATDDIVFAVDDPEHSHQIVIVRWTAERGAQVQRIRSDSH